MNRVASFIGILISGMLALAGASVEATAAELDLRSVGLQDGMIVSMPDAITDPDGRKATVLIPLAEKVLVLDLVKHSVRADSFRMVATAEAGRLETVRPTPVETYRGTIRNDLGSVAAISILPDGIAGRVKSGDGREIWIEPISRRIRGARPRDHVVYESADVAPFEGRCGVPDQEGPPPLGGRSDGVARMASGAFCTAQIAIDCDFPFFQLMGEDLEFLGRRIDTVLNTMNLQYNNQVAIDHKVTMILVRRTEAADPYVGSTLCDVPGTAGLEDQVNAIWGAAGYLPNVTRDIVHLFTARPTGGIIGCNWVGQVCQQTPYGASRIDFNGNLASSTDLLAHELGHGWGAGHCSCFNPPFTMNSSITSANNFNPNISIPTITTYRNANSGCLDCAAEPTDACGGVSGSCYSESDPVAPFCSDEDCCIIICAIDPFCCQDWWDDVCVGRALEICAGCGDENAGSPFEENGTPGCSDRECCELICGLDDYCCSTEWDEFCAADALINCTSCGDDDAGSPYQIHGPGSNDMECCRLVCGLDPACCVDEWDENCISSSVRLCAGCGSEEAGSPFLNNGTPGCDDADCCIRVCEIDPFCCETSWDSNCARSAAFRCFGWCQGDFNFDGKVEGGDLGILISEWGSESAELEDLNDDLIVDGADFGIFLGNWGECDY